MIFCVSQQIKNKLKELVQNTPYYQSMDEDAYDVVVNYANITGLIAAKEYCMEDEYVYGD